MAEDKLVIFEVTDTPAIPGRPTHARGQLDNSAAQAIETSAGAIEQSLTGFINAVKTMLEKVEDEAGLYKLSKVEVAAQVSSQGKVGFMGVGLAASASSSLKIEFTRR